jgi:hypothetical protein
VAYHGGIGGHNPLTVSIIHKCGYTELNSTNVIKSYNDIIYLHAEVLDCWEHPCGLYRGPQINRILEKGLPTFPRLTCLTVTDTVEFYNAFQKTSVIYLLPVMPFNCISLRMGFEDLCPPGLDIQQYATIARVLMEILPKILPRSNTKINSIVNMVCMDSGNGYVLMWCVLELSVPGFDPAIPVKLPCWGNNDVFTFALSFTLYFCLQAKKGVVYDDPTQSTTFLAAVKDPAYVNVITTLTTCLTNYYTAGNDGYLPSHLCTMGLATQLNNNAQAQARAIIPQAYRSVGQFQSDGFDVYRSVGQFQSDGFNVPIQGTPRSARMDGRREIGTDGCRNNGFDRYWDNRGGSERPRDERGGRDGGRNPRSCPPSRPYVQGGTRDGNCLPCCGQYA